MSGRLIEPRLQDREVIVDAFEVLGDALAIAAQVGAHIETFGNREKGKYLASFRHMPQAHAHDAIRAQALDRRALKFDAAFLWVEHAGDGLEHGGLAGAVGAEHGDDLATRDLEADAANRHDW